MRRYVGAMVVAVAMVAVLGMEGVSQAQVSPGFFNFSVGNSGYGPAGYSASFGAYPQPFPYYAARPSCGPVPYGAAYGGVPYVGGYGRPAYGAFYRPVAPLPYYGGYSGYGHHCHPGYRGW